LMVQQVLFFYYNMLDQEKEKILNEGKWEILSGIIRFFISFLYGSGWPRQDPALQRSC
jgi:hypothetical protein